MSDNPKTGALPPDPSVIGMNAAQLWIHNRGDDHFDAGLVGMPVAEAYEWITAAGLQSNLWRDPKTNEIITIARVLVVMPGFRTVHVKDGFVHRIERE